MQQLLNDGTNPCPQKSLLNVFWKCSSSSIWQRFAQHRHWLELANNDMTNTVCKIDEEEVCSKWWWWCLWWPCNEVGICCCRCISGPKTEAPSPAGTRQTWRLWNDAMLTKKTLVVKMTVLMKIMITMMTSIFFRMANDNRLTRCQRWYKLTVNAFDPHWRRWQWADLVVYCLKC